MPSSCLAAKPAQTWAVTRKRASGRPQVSEHAQSVLRTLTPFRHTMSDLTPALRPAGFKDSKRTFWLSHCQGTRADIHYYFFLSDDSLPLSSGSLPWEMAFHHSLSCFDRRPVSPCVSLIGSFLTLIYLVRRPPFVAQQNNTTSAPFTCAAGTLLLCLFTASRSLCNHHHKGDGKRAE